jgi:hypothetical protein
LARRGFCSGTLARSFLSSRIASARSFGSLVRPRLTMVGRLAFATLATWNGFDGRDGCRRELGCRAWAAAFDPSFVSCSEIEQASLRKFVRRAGHQPATVGHFFEVFLFHRSTAGPFGRGRRMWRRPLIAGVLELIACDCEPAYRRLPPPQRNPLVKIDASEKG